MLEKFLNDPKFGIEVKMQLNFLKKLSKEVYIKIMLLYNFNTRFEYLDEETIKYLKYANFRFILIGLESGSDYTLNKLNKG